MWMQPFYQLDCTLELGYLTHPGRLVMYSLLGLIIIRFKCLTAFSNQCFEHEMNSHLQNTMIQLYLSCRNQVGMFHQQ